MIRFVKRLWNTAPIATVVLVVSLLVAGVFTTRAVAFWIYWNDPAHRAQAIEPWMTPKYVAHSWDVPPQVVRDALGEFKRDKNGPMSLDQVAKSQGIALEDLIAKIETAIETFEANRTTPDTPTDNTSMDAS